MRYALIGCGRIARNHIIAAKKNGLDIVAVCDISVQKAEKFLAENELLASTPIYTDYKMLCEEQRPQLAAIATESGSHAEIALYFIDAGVHLIIEKPIAMCLSLIHI